ncbi:hypothetical protein KEM54_002262, partial [Ascosphaera aggregata]
MGESTLVNSSQEQVLNDLEREYCPPLDAALFAAIALDYDLAKQSSLNALRDILDALRAEAAADQLENAAFDPSGTGGAQHDHAIDDGASYANEHGRSIALMEKDMHTLEKEMSAMNMSISGTSSASPRFHMSESAGGAFQVDLDEADKLQYLREMFPAIDAFTVRYYLGKCERDVDRCMDTLLNFAFFEDLSQSQSDTGTVTGAGTSTAAGAVTDDKDGAVCLSVPKGVEGFSQDAIGVYDGPCGGKKKSKRRNARRNRNGRKECDVRHLSAPDNHYEGKENAINNKWTTASKDVDFVVSRTKLSAASVSSTYHSNNANIAATIHVLAENEVARRGAKSLLEDEVTQTQVAEMKIFFANAFVSPSSSSSAAAAAAPELDSLELKFAGLLSISRNVMSAAIELAQIMLETPSLASSLPNIIFKPTPLNIENAEIANPCDNAQPLFLQDKPPPAKSSSNITSSLSSAATHFSNATSAFAAASSAYRRSKSDHLYSAVAAHYSSIGREHLALAKSSSSAAADALVASQSGPDFLDLH